MSKKETVVGIIGAGRIGRLHTGLYNRHVDGVRVGSVCDVVKDSAKSCAEQEGIGNYSDNCDDIFSDGEIDAVVICSSTDTHAEMINLAADAGKHIFCEKPISFDIDRITETLSKVEKAGVKLQIGFNRRFDPNFARVREAVVNGDIGDLHFVRVTSRDPSPPPIEYIKRSGGLFFDMTIHDFDMVRFISGSEVEEVYASGAVLVDGKIGEAGDIDTAVINLKFKNGALGIIENSRQAVYGYDQRVEAFGTGGMVEAANVPANTVTLSTASGLKNDLIPFLFIERYIDSYINEMRHFIDCVSKDEKPSVTGLDGLEPVYVAKACMVSMREKRAVKIEEVR
jgi:myo-inositol 2-dehydrogenase/D-chiro-inositol 1-dehydrogenase